MSVGSRALAGMAARHFDGANSAGLSNKPRRSAGSFNDRKASLSGVTVFEVKRLEALGGDHAG
ncbi:hypothetical protein [Paracoccus rhizosphaerae]|uniref:Transposase n=1 Tax=Paracoccus rhizosphaerae TaxID=1133347 RepID=A0ABV6CE50_9RHOB|nr:hypothetical protein [Paracoccus rhizosphaerae]